MSVSSRPVKVLIADDHTLFRVGLANLLTTDSRVEIVGQARDGQDALDQARARKPDVVLMDAMMPKIDGIEATRILGRDAPEINVLILSAYGDGPAIGQAMASGAKGFVHKDASLPEIMTTILDASPSRPATRKGHRPDLSHREVIVLREVASGLSNKQIARRLAISEKTVRNHLSRVYGKLGATNRTEAVIHALRSGVVIA